MLNRETLVRIGLITSLVAVGLVAVNSYINEDKSNLNLNDNPSLLPNLPDSDPQTPIQESQLTPIADQYVTDPLTGARLKKVTFGDTTCIELGEYSSGNGQSVYDASRFFGDPYVSFDIPSTEIYGPNLVSSRPEESHLGNYFTTVPGGLSGDNVGVGTFVCPNLIVPEVTITP